MHASYCHCEQNTHDTKYTNDNTPFMHTSAVSSALVGSFRLVFLLLGSLPPSTEGSTCCSKN